MEHKQKTDTPINENINFTTNKNVLIKIPQFQHTKRGGQTHELLFMNS